MTNGEFAKVFPPKLYEAFPALALFNPVCRDVTIKTVRFACAENPHHDVDAVLDFLCTEQGLCEVARAIFGLLNANHYFGIA